MKQMKPVLWTVFGVILGAAAVLSTGHVQAQSAAPDPAGDRLVMTSITPRGWGRMYVVFDTKSNGCWLGSYDSGSAAFSSLAVAPPSACATQ